MKINLNNALLLMCSFVAIIQIPLHDPVGPIVYFRLFFLAVLSIEIVRRYVLFIRNRPGSPLLNVLTVVVSVYCVLAVLESIFMFYPRSNGSGESLAARLWWSKYYNPGSFNSLGFRDIEPERNEPAIVFVGDSFTAGDGLENPDDRFSNIVRSGLRAQGLRYCVSNIGAGGLDTRWEYDTLLRFVATSRIKPKKIILEYFGNDIERVASEMGLKFKGNAPYAAVPGFLKPVVKGSYLCNYIFWLFPRSFEVPYTEYLKQAYANKDILARHEEDLQLFIQYARDNSAELLVLVFPFMDDLEMSNRLYVGQIVDFFSSRGIVTINVSQLIKDLPLKERVIHANDAHASRKVNMIVAQEILQLLR